MAPGIAGALAGADAPWDFGDAAYGPEPSSFPCRPHEWRR